MKYTKYGPRSDDNWVCRQTCLMHIIICAFIYLKNSMDFVKYSTVSSVYFLIHRITYYEEFDSILRLYSWIFQNLGSHEDDLNYWNGLHLKCLTNMMFLKISPIPLLINISNSLIIYFKIFQCISNQSSLRLSSHSCLKRYIFQEFKYYLFWCSWPVWWTFLILK